MAVFVRVRFSVECVLLGAIILRLAGNGNPEYPHALDAFDIVEVSLAIMHELVPS